MIKYSDILLDEAKAFKCSIFELVNNYICPDASCALDLNIVKAVLFEVIASLDVAKACSDKICMEELEENE